MFHEIYVVLFIYNYEFVHNIPSTRELVIVLIGQDLFM